MCTEKTVHKVVCMLFIIDRNDMNFHLSQGWAASALKCRCPAEFSSNPNQTHLNNHSVVVSEIDPYTLIHHAIHYSTNIVHLRGSEFNYNALFKGGFGDRLSCFVLFSLSRVGAKLSRTAFFIFRTIPFIHVQYCVFVIQ